MTKSKFFWVVLAFFVLALYSAAVQAEGVTQCRDSYFGTLAVGSSKNKCDGFDLNKYTCESDGVIRLKGAVEANSNSCKEKPKICANGKAVSSVWWEGVCDGKYTVYSKCAWSDSTGAHVVLGGSAEFPDGKQLVEGNACGYTKPKGPTGGGVPTTCGDKKVGAVWWEGACYGQQTQYVKCHWSDDKGAHVVSGGTPEFPDGRQLVDGNCGWPPQQPPIKAKASKAAAAAPVQQAPNNAPVLSFIGDKIVKVGQLLKFIITGIDPDNDPLSYSASNLPQGATFDPIARAFRWTPEEKGLFNNVQFSVTDSQLTDTESININVMPAAPGNFQLARIDLFDSCVEPGSELMFSVNMENNAGERLDAVSLTAFVPELGARTRIGPDELGKGRETTRQLSIEVPGNAAAGEYYLMLGVNEDDGNIRRIKYRPFMVKEACN